MRQVALPMEFAAPMRVGNAAATAASTFSAVCAMGIRKRSSWKATSNQPSPADQPSRTLIAAPKGTPKSSTTRSICQAKASPLSQNGYGKTNGTQINQI